LRPVFGLPCQTANLWRIKILAQWCRSRHDEPPGFAMLNLTRLHLGIAHESQFQGLGIRPAISQAGLTPRSPEPAFGRDDQAFRIRVERFGNEPLVDLRTVGVGGIDEGDAELDSTHQHALSTRTIKRFTPYTRAAQAHGAEPEAIHGRVATEGEAATRTIRPQPVR